MKWPFNRKNKDVASVPEEIQEYYQAERRERTGIAWLLALGTLLVTIALAILLFFAGRWAYRAVTNGDGNGNGQVAEVNQEPRDSASESPASDDANGGQDTDSADGTSDTPADDGSEPSANGSTSAPSDTPQSPATTPVTGDGLPDTGPGNAVSLFAATTIVSAAAHRLVTTRRRGRLTPTRNS